MSVRKIVSGGQTGVDRAALDAAREVEIPIGGWCPRGRRAEDGPIDERYPLQETPSDVYAQRTSWNVRDSDGTLVIAPDETTGGTAFTIEEAERYRKPLLQVKNTDTKDAPTRIQRWIKEHDITVLNVAGPRASEVPGIYEEARRILEPVFAEYA